jgi:LacI family transcriptional regulator
MSSINIKELALQLNLSKSTVSRAFRGHSDINLETKERILKVAKQLNYQPNHHASNLRAQKSKNIAIIVPQIANNFFSQAIDGIETVAREKGYHLLIYLTADHFESEVAYVNDLYNGRADGIIMSVSGEANDHSYMKKLQEKQIPLVFFDRVYDDIHTAKVTTNDYASSFEATMHLVEAGCKNIAFLATNKQLSIGKMRMQGYLDALKHSGLPFRDELIVDCTNDDNQNHGLLTHAFKTLAIDGVFASVERLAFSTYYVCADLQISIPGQVKVISFSSLEIAPLLNPSLTTITQPAYDMGVQAATLLFKMFAQDDAVNDQIVLSSKIIRRNSTL